MAERVAWHKRFDADLRYRAKLQGKRATRADRVTSPYRMTSHTVKGNQHSWRNKELPVLHGQIVQTGMHVTSGQWARVTNRA